MTSPEIKLNIQEEAVFINAKRAVMKALVEKRDPHQIFIPRATLDLMDIRNIVQMLHGEGIQCLDIKQGKFEVGGEVKEGMVFRPEPRKESRAKLEREAALCDFSNSDY